MGLVLLVNDGGIVVVLVTSGCVCLVMVFVRGWCWWWVLWTLRVGDVLSLVLVCGFGI